MNTTIKIIVSIFLISIYSCNGKVENLTINTPTIQCGMCQKTIELGLKKLSGVSRSKVDLKTKSTIVSYNPDKTNLANIEKTISDLGYQANNVKANEKSYEELPACCKIGGMDKK